MAVIEIMTFRLAADADEAEFLAADHTAQTDVVYQQPGIIRRTTARGADGEWLVLTLWATESEADAAPTALASGIDESTVHTRRYSTLD